MRSCSPGWRASDSSPGAARVERPAALRRHGAAAHAGREAGVASRLSRSTSLCRRGTVRARVHRDSPSTRRPRPELPPPTRVPCSLPGRGRLRLLGPHVPWHRRGGTGVLRAPARHAEPCPTPVRRVTAEHRVTRWGSAPQSESGALSDATPECAGLRRLQTRALVINSFAGSRSLSGEGVPVHPDRRLTSRSSSGEPPHRGSPGREPRPWTWPSPPGFARGR